MTFPSPLIALQRSSRKAGRLALAQITDVQDQFRADPTLSDVCEDESPFLEGALTLMCAAWEAFVEDFAEFSFQYFLDKTENSSDLPLSSRRKISAQIKENKHEMAPWFLSGKSWKDYTLKFVQERIQGLNTPKPSNIDELFNDLLGTTKICDSWECEIYNSQYLRTSLTRMVEERGAVAHGRRPSLALTSSLLLHWHSCVTACSVCMCNKIRSDFETLFSSAPWHIVRFKPTPGADELINMHLP